MRTDTPIGPKSLTLLDFDAIRRRLADHASFSGGRRLALALEPSADAAEVRRRLARTSEARDFVDRRGRPEMGGAHDMRPEIEGAERGKTLLPAELLDVRDTLTAARRMRRAFTREAARWPKLSLVAEPLEECPALVDAIQAALDDEGNVRDGASPALGRIRREMRVLHDRLMRQLEGLVGATGLRDVLQESLITQRAGRYVVPVKAEFRSRLPGVVHDTSDSGATIFVEPLAAVENGNRLRELAIDEEKEVARILRELSADVAAEADALRDTIRALADLDLAFACGDHGHALRAVAPRIVEAEAPALDYPAARHPLLDPGSVVPVDVRVGEGHRLLVITGPNTGGKTVTLKTVGLLTLMAQAGLHIPAAEGARLTVFDGVYADIGDEQSIEQSLSTFSGHMTNLIAILEVAGPRSLVLLDELGAGTDPVEGATLARALLEHLRARAVTTVASTHYSELKVYAHETPGVANASVEFDVETLRPTYELTIGLPGRSNALAIAARLGLPAPIIEAARAGLTSEMVDMEALLGEIRDARRAAAADREATAAARAEAERWSERLEAAVRDVEAQRAELLNTARAQAAGELEAAREAVAQLLARAERGAAGSAALAAATADIERLRSLLPVAPAVPPGFGPEAGELAPGTRVRVVSFGQRGEILRADDDTAEVQLGRLRLSVPLSDLEVLDPAEPEPAALASEGVRVQRAAGADEALALEVDLRGLRVEEGLDRLDAYLDDASLVGLPWVRVIHGHGTGAMKAAVRDALAHHPLVVRARPGDRGEGGDGVTVAYFTDSP